MAASDRSQVTRTLEAVQKGDHASLDRLLALVYDELRELASGYLKRESGGHTLQPTALVHEVFLKLVDQTKVDWQGRTHFFAVSAQAMRRILVDHARRKGRTKRGGRRRRVELDERVILSPRRVDDIIAVDDALHRLVEVDPRQANVVELRFFGGLTVADVAEALGVSKRTVESEWKMARAWLRRELSEDSDT